MDVNREFTECAITHTPSLMRSAYLLTGNQHAAEDLVQASLARTHRHWRRVRDADSPIAYTKRIMYNQQASWWRRRRVRERLTGDIADLAENAGGDGGMAAADMRMVLRSALHRLSPRQRAVVVLRYFEDKSVAETADVLRCSEGTVKTQSFRALNRLREILPGFAELTNGA